MLSADGLSVAKPLNASAFASDLIFMAGIVSVLITMCLSVILLLPRNMSAEALPPTAQPAKMRMVAYSANPSQSLGGSGSAHADQLAILGMRLNLDREAMCGMTEDLLELPPIPSKPGAPSSSDTSDVDGDGDSTHGYKASQSEENIFGHQAAMNTEEATSSPARRGVRWSTAPSLRALERERERARDEAPTLPMSPMVKRGSKVSGVWVHTETTEQ
jgi:hypothetical protein